MDAHRSVQSFSTDFRRIGLRPGAMRGAALVALLQSLEPAQLANIIGGSIEAHEAWAMLAGNPSDGINNAAKNRQSATLSLDATIAKRVYAEMQAKITGTQSLPTPEEAPDDFRMVRICFQD